MKGEVFIVKDSLGQLLAERLKKYSNAVILTDENTRAFCYPVLSGLPPHHVMEVPSGEEHKNLDTCKMIWQRLTDLNFDRHSLLIVLGGGVLGDMGGFCAATFKRGIDFMLMPTTLLSQVDASIGGKLGIDFNNFKNHIGVFCEPQITFIYTPFFKTLPARELRSGFAEVIKHCLISDKKMWDVIRNKSLEEQDWNSLVKHSVDFKKSVTETDPTEKGLRKILNFGHTIGHALESYFLSNGNRIFHGEAIAMGMIMESYVATQTGLMTEEELNEIQRYVLTIFPKEKSPYDENEVLRLMLQDKKNKDGKILMALPEGIGKAKWDVRVGEDLIKKAFRYDQNL
jgi:3-dehydroquinate synthase